MNLDEAIQQAEERCKGSSESEAYHAYDLVKMLNELKARRELDLPRPKPFWCKLGFHKAEVRTWKAEDYRTVKVLYCRCGSMLSSHYIPPRPWPKIHPRPRPR